MNPLPTELRNKLERTIIEARDEAEKGAKAALEAMAVHHHEPYGHMSPEQRKLRNHLRARARQLGDKQNREGKLEITHFVWECAYEHWNRMLFARFLAENDLLIEPEMDVAISLEECEELAKEAGKDLWTLASEFAQRMLPQIFRPNDPVLRVTFASEHRLKLEKLLNDLEPSVFTASDSLGWVYQFWQSKRKKEVNQSGNKIGADELPAVTQLFTEPYMVSFLLDNSLGVWWAARRLTEADLKNAENEEELRSKASLPSVPLEYLRFVKVAEASSLCKKEIGYFHKDEPITNLSGDLPHWRQEGVTYFVTFRTADSLPQEKLKQWQLEKERWLHDHPEPCDGKAKREFYEKFPERLQHWLDQGYGECVLKDQDCKKIVEEALRHFDGQRYDLDEFVVMPNHIHVLVTPKAGHELSEILHSWKSFTATEINKRMGRSGAFWQKESFDHIVRNPDQVEKIRQYIKEHPAYSGRGFQPQKNQRQDAAATLNGSATIWTPAAATFEGWPEHLSELKTLDPCCGSGHFLVAAFLMLVPMRMDLEGLSARDACDAVLRENIHGLELDQRCVELAAFALALAAWRYPDAGGYRPLPELNLACTGLSVNVTKAEWKSIARVLPDKSYVPIALDWLYDEFQNAPVLGSLLNPSRAKVASLVQWDTLIPTLKETLKQEKDDETYETGVVAQGLAKATQLLSGKYHWVVTNVPYLARGKQVETLKAFCVAHYPAAKNDLATVFLDRCLGFCKVEAASSRLNKRQDGASTASTGTVSVVLPQNWLFLTTYKKFREKLLRNDTWHMIARLGPGAFETISGEVVKAILLILSRGNRVEEASGLLVKQQDAASTSTIRGLDVSALRTAKEKAELLLKAEILEVEQERQLENPDARVIIENVETSFLLAKYAQGVHGFGSKDSPRFFRQFWEIVFVDDDWQFLQTTVESTKCWDGLRQVVYWQNGKGILAELGRIGLAIPAGAIAWGKKGIAISQMRILPCAFYGGEIFDKNVAVILPNNPDHLPAIWCFCSSLDYNQAVRQMDQSLKVTNATLVKVPFNLPYWQKVAAEKYPNGLPKPYSDDPTQWIFHGHPARVATASSRCDIQSQNGSATLQVAMARLLGYRWPAELECVCGSGFQPLNKEKRQAGASTMELSDKARAWVKQSKALLSYADKDGIVCIPSVRGEEPAGSRLQEFLAAAYESGSGFQPLDNQRQDAAATISAAFLPATFQDWLNKLLVQTDPAANLDEWLRDHFFEQHCKLFHHRPFIWHIWDGRRRDGFHALVNYHKLAEGNGKGRQLLESLTYSYLGDWIIRQKEGVKQGEGGAEDRLAAALELQKRLIAIIEGEPPFDIFVRWKPIEEQPIGWEPDINGNVSLR